MTAVELGRIAEAAPEVAGELREIAKSFDTQADDLLGFWAEDGRWDGFVIKTNVQEFTLNYG